MFHAKVNKNFQGSKNKKKRLDTEYNICELIWKKLSAPEHSITIVAVRSGIQDLNHFIHGLGGI